jgi:hypothetical protein
LRVVPSPPSLATVRRNRLAVAYWTVAVLVYALLGVRYQPFFLLGFWECLPFLLGATWLAGRLLPHVIPPLPSRDDTE